MMYKILNRNDSLRLETAMAANLLKIRSSADLWPRVTLKTCRATGVFFISNET